jgi:hypothetical protein
VLAHLDTLQTRHDQPERKDRKFRLVKGLIERGWDAERVRQLFRLIDWMMDLPTPMEIEFLEQLTQHGKEKQMPYITTPERIGMERGISQGLCQGIEGMLKLKFQDAGLRLMPEIRQINDNEKLAAIVEAIPTSASPEDLRRIWAN